MQVTGHNISVCLHLVYIQRYISAVNLIKQEVKSQPWHTENSSVFDKVAIRPEAGSCKIILVVLIEVLILIIIQNLVTIIEISILLWNGC